MELSTEMRFLLYSAALMFTFILINVLSQINAVGLSALMGNRDEELQSSRFCRRSQRLIDNMQENLVIFGAIVLVAQATGVSTPGTVLGVQLFFYARVVHGACYLLGIPWLRTGAWAVSVIGMAMVFVDVLSV